MENPTPEPAREPRWRPIAAIDRRVLGVLIEKAKTTPNAYPLSLSALTTGCNQKSSRFPVMELEPEDVEESLERLRELGAVGIIEGYGRVNKYRHYGYEWLGVDKAEAAVMAELLLRGAQTAGALRGRAARMEPIANLAALHPILASLKSKGLVVPITPEGRGHVVAHALYSPRELERIMAEHGRRDSDVAAASPQPPDAPAPAARESVPAAPPATVATAPALPASPDPAAEVAESLQRELEELRSQVAQVRSDLDDLTTAHDQVADELRRLRDELGA